MILQPEAREHVFEHVLLFKNDSGQTVVVSLAVNENELLLSVQFGETVLKK